VSGPGGHADTRYLLDASGPAAPPRDNGELTFAAPWESQAFGLALALHEAGLIDWEDFRQRLIAEISSWEAGRSGPDKWSYYGCWLRALEGLAAERGLVRRDDLHVRTVRLAARPPDHGPPSHRHEDAQPSGAEQTGAGPAVPAPPGASHAR
jgi:nitrile hydratase accessory protein